MSLYKPAIPERLAGVTKDWVGLTVDIVYICVHVLYTVLKKTFWSCKQTFTYKSSNQGMKPRPIYRTSTASLIRLLKKLTAGHKGTTITEPQAQVTFYYALGCLGLLHQISCWLHICKYKLWALFEASLKVFQSLYLWAMLC